ALNESRWERIPDFAATSTNEFVLTGIGDRPVTIEIPWPSIRQILRSSNFVWLSTERDIFLIQNGRAHSLGAPPNGLVRQIAVDRNEVLWAATSAGLFWLQPEGWAIVGLTDEADREWAMHGV